MKIGIFLFATGESVDVAVMAKRAEELGFDSFWVPEHPILPVKTTSPHPVKEGGKIPETYAHILDPFVALGRASAVTKKIKLGTGICLVPERNPLLLAKEVATLDHLSGGRFIFGIGAGWLKEETEIMGGDFDHRWTQTRESVLAMKELWTKDEAAFHGHYYNFPAVRCSPKPVQRPHPPVYIGSNSKNVFKWVVEYASGWMPIPMPLEELKQGRATLNKLARQAGRDPRSIEVLAFGLAGNYRSREEIKKLEEAGATQVTIWLEPTEGIAEMEQVAGEVLDRAP